jgi:L-lactate dehydrogenase (cytochrome)
VLARAAAAADIPMVLAGSSLIRLEDVKREGATAWFQAYLPGDDETIRSALERAQRAKYETLVVTLDVQVAANRENNVRNGFHTPLRPTLRLAWDGLVRPRWLFGMFLRTLLVHGMPHFENMGPRVPLISRRGEREAGRRDRLSWSHVALMRRLWPGKLVLKGILDKDDAAKAREAGVDGIIVSNHGGRQLDGAVAPLRVLPQIAASAGGMTVMLDGGVRRGTDVLKALALGASFVWAGRPFCYAARKSTATWRCSASTRSPRCGASSCWERAGARASLCPSADRGSLREAAPAGAAARRGACSRLRA